MDYWTRRPQFKSGHFSYVKFCFEIVIIYTYFFKQFKPRQLLYQREILTENILFGEIRVKIWLTLGALDSRIGISHGTPNTKRCSRNPIECPTCAVGHSIVFWKHSLVLKLGYAEWPAWTSTGNLEIISVYRRTP